jgi:hypothetical protein
METTRSSIFDDMDLSDFQPKKDKPARHDQETTKEAAQKAGFKSREAQPAPVKTAPPVQRRRRTGRNAQFNIKAKPDTIQLFMQVADAQEWGLGETLEKAVELLLREYTKA